MSLYELAALTAAGCWALASLISSAPARHLGGISFNHLRLVLVFVMLLFTTLISGRYGSVNPEHVLPILLSGFIGFFLGDSLLFLCLNRLGPRRMSVLFATNAPMAALLGWIFLEETLSGRNLFGIILITSGVILAIVFGKRRSQLHHWETVHGSLWVGVLLRPGRRPVPGTGCLDCATGHGRWC
ncbi:MAG: DMT family transporter [Thiolinea sp.]